MKDNNKDRIYRHFGDAEAEEIYRFLELFEEKHELFKKLKTLFFSIAKTKINYKIANHWEEIGLLEDKRGNKGQGWRKFSLIDIAWIEILVYLREWNFSLNVLKNIKEHLFQDISSNIIYLDNSKTRKYGVSHLEKAFFRAFTFIGNNTYLIIFKNGESFVTNKHQINVNTYMRRLPEGYLVINLNQLWNNPFVDIKVHDDPPIPFDNKEIEILLKLRSPNNREIKVKKSQEGDIELIEEGFSGDIDLNKILKNIEYGEANIKIKNNKIVHIQGLKKQKLDKNNQKS